jgi:spore coat polysaccharide biosynthesis predicted glycosyltransferase SpsG
MGGSDPQHFTERVLSALINLERDCHVAVILGNHFSLEREQELLKLAGSNQERCRIVRSPENMAALLRGADIAIMNNGLTKYESVLLGIPTIVLDYDPVKMLGSEGFEAKELFCVLEKGKGITSDQILNAVKNLLGDASLRKKLSTNGRAYFDENGANRIFSSIPKEYIYEPKN